MFYIECLDAVFSSGVSSLVCLPTWYPSPSHVGFNGSPHLFSLLPRCLLSSLPGHSLLSSPYSAFGSHVSDALSLEK